MDSVKQFPYTLTVTVKSGEKLKVAGKHEITVLVKPCSSTTCSFLMNNDIRPFFER